MFQFVIVQHEQNLKSNKICSIAFSDFFLLYTLFDSNKTVHREFIFHTYGKTQFSRTNVLCCSTLNRISTLQTVGHVQRLVEKITIFANKSIQIPTNVCVFQWARVVYVWKIGCHKSNSHVQNVGTSFHFIEELHRRTSSAATESFRNSYLLNKFHRIQIIERRQLIWIWSCGFLFQQKST